MATLSAFIPRRGHLIREILLGDAFHRKWLKNILPV